ncbi:MAG: hypothetical protein JWM34_1626 [Ilumatobacteraceae bacterium]|nr:hypothetical protein [Ilumatobacteraceae bacterium]
MTLPSGVQNRTSLITAGGGVDETRMWRPVAGLNTIALSESQPPHNFTDLEPSLLSFVTGAPMVSATANTDAARSVVAATDSSSTAVDARHERRLMPRHVSKHFVLLSQIRCASVAIALVAAAVIVPAVLGAGSALAVAPAVPIDLGAAASYSVLTPAAVGNTASAPGAHHTTLRGDLGAGGAVTGFPPGVVTGATRGGSDIAPALASLATAYADAAGRSPALPLVPDLIGVTLDAGVYGSAGAVANTGTMTLDGQGNPNGVFVLQIGGALGMAAASKVLLTNGAQASRVFWQVSGAATIGAGAVMVGTVMAHDAVGVGAGALVNGRVLAITGAVAVNDNDFFSNPPSISITGGASAITNTSAPTISGVTDVEVPSNVTVVVAGQTFSASVVSGAWSVALPLLANGTYAISASATDAAGNIGAATQALTIDTVLPIITIVGGAASLTNDSTPTVSGTTDVPAGSIVSVVVGAQTWTAIVQSDGSWNVTTTALADGARLIMATVTDAAHNSASGAQTLTVDTSPAVVAIDGGASALTNDPSPTISGTADLDPGTALMVVVEGQRLPGAVGAAGRWSVDSARMSDGVHYITVSTTDSAGNASQAAQALTIDTVRPIVTIVGGATFGTNDSTPTTRGTADVAAGSVITVSYPGGQLTTLVQVDGTWNVTPLALSNGTYVVTASATDTAGNIGSMTQAITVDTNAPAVISTGGATATTSDPTHPITGTSTAPPGSVVTVTVAGQTLTTTVGADGTWSVTPSTLANGTYTVVVAVTTPAAQVNTAVQVLTVDTAAGPGPATTPDFTPVGPHRVLDTRPGESPNALRSVASHKLGGADGLEVRLTDLAGYVPADGVGAVSLNVTATNTDGSGYVTVFACGTRPLVSSLNISTGRNVANAVVTPVSARGDVCFYSSVPTDLVVDVNGWFAAGQALSAVGPARLFDTRPGESPNAVRAVPSGQILAGTMLEVSVSDLAGLVPAGPIAAVSLNVTATNPQAAGYVTVYPCGARQLVSSVNFAAGQTVANAVIAPVSARGTVCFYASVTTDLVVDINGWVKDDSGFTASDPHRVLDTRRGESPDALRTVAKQKIGGDSVLEVQVTDLVGLVPSTGVSAVSLNVTVTNPESDGFVTVYPCGTRESVSSLNYVAGATVANAVLAPVSASGTVCIYSQGPVDVIVDINGWFSG